METAGIFMAGLGILLFSFYFLGLVLLEVWIFHDSKYKKRNNEHKEHKEHKKENNNNALKKVNNNDWVKNENNVVNNH